MTPAVLLPAVQPGRIEHRRRYDRGRPFWWCSAVSGPCPGHGAPPPPPPPGCTRGHPPNRMRQTTNGHGQPSRRCLDCLNWLRSEARRAKVAA